MNLPEDKPLKNTLQTWKVSEPLPGRFNENVWRRIAHAEAQPASTLGAWCNTWLAAAFAKPAFATAYLAVLLAAGLTAGYLRGESRQHRINDDLAARYVQSLDPYRHNLQ